MEDEEMMNVDSAFSEWWRKQNIEDVGIKELAGNAFFEGYEKAKKTLNEQIEKMKNCTNCRNNDGFGCKVSDDCEKFSRWELEE